MWVMKHAHWIAAINSSIWKVIKLTTKPNTIRLENINFQHIKYKCGRVNATWLKPMFSRLFWLSVVHLQLIFYSVLYSILLSAWISSTSTLLIWSSSTETPVPYITKVKQNWDRSVLEWVSLQVTCLLYDLSRWLRHYINVECCVELSMVQTTKRHP